MVKLPLEKLLSYISFYLCVLLLSTEAFEEIKFVDIDQFKFTTSQRSGLRICVFNLKEQQYESITYYNLPATKGRQLDGVMLDDFYGLSVTYSGDITISAPLEGKVLRTKGRIQADHKDLTSFVDDEERTIAYHALHPLPAPDLAKHLNKNFSKAPYKQTSFSITVCTLPSRTLSSVDLDTIAADRRENNAERGIIGELATRMTLFCYGFFEKIPSQDNSGQGIDGVYFQSNGKEDERQALFLTESKCKNASASPKKILDTQLEEKVLYENIERLDHINKERILNFIDSSPNKVFKAAHRILITGTSQWRVESFNIKDFRVQRLGVASPEKDKKAFIATIASKFTSPEEMLRVMFEYYKIDNDAEKLAVVYRALNCAPENKQETQSEICTQEEPKLVDSPGPSISVKQISYDAQKGTVARRLSFGSATITVKSEIKVEYSRENLSILLAYIAKGFKRSSLKKINAGLRAINSEFTDLTPSELTQLSNFAQYKNYKKKASYESLWELLLKAFPDQYKQTLADGLYNLDTSKGAPQKIDSCFLKKVLAEPF
ncbi:hypothetical protein [Candidatus Odyssella thessalonicensis]|uniref:hypothetical protein n=1 Tax=Candidatus Odyssella thessalonicensis TaxID=84647 RepID=UPI000225B436|nr:hypothetical protein [Candidatus Odyssella thessalonicensis]